MGGLNFFFRERKEIWGSRWWWVQTDFKISAGSISIPFCCAHVWGLQTRATTHNSLARPSRSHIGRCAGKFPPHCAFPASRNTYRDCFVSLSSAPKLEPATTSHPVLPSLLPSRLQLDWTRVEPFAFVLSLHLSFFAVVHCNQANHTSFPMFLFSSFTLSLSFPSLSNLFPFHSVTNFRSLLLRWCFLWHLKFLG